MTKYVIAMKSGFSFTIEVKDFGMFIAEMNSHIRPEVVNNFHADGGVMFNINDISAIFPLFSLQSVQRNGHLDPLWGSLTVKALATGTGENVAA